MDNLTIAVHEIAVHGLPPRDMKLGGMATSYAGRVAFLFDGCIVSGWPVYPEDHAPLYRPHRREVLWEADSDVGDGTRLFSDVTHWIEFPMPLWEAVA